MGSATLTLIGFNDSNNASPDGPDVMGRYIIEEWKFVNADGIGNTVLIPAKRLTKIISAKGNNVDNYTSNIDITIDNTVFPPTATVNGIAAGDCGTITLRGL